MEKHKGIVDYGKSARAAALVSKAIEGIVRYPVIPPDPAYHGPDYDELLMMYGEGDFMPPSPPLSVEEHPGRHYGWNKMGEWDYEDDLPSPPA